MNSIWWQWLDLICMGSLLGIQWIDKRQIKDLKQRVDIQDMINRTQNRGSE